MKLQEWQKKNRFMPLTYIECLADKPLVIKLTDDWNYVTYPQKAINFAIIADAHINIFGTYEILKKSRPKKEEKKLQKTKDTLSLTYQLIEVLFEISKQEYKDRESEYKKFLYGHFLENINVLFDVWEKVFEYNTKIEKKNRIPDELKDNSTRREMDRWRGFFAGRSPRQIQTSSFLKLIHDDEAKKLEEIASYENQKQRQKNNERNARRRSYK